MSNLPKTIDFENSLNLSKEEIREFIAHIESQMSTGVPVEVPVKHHFSKDVYAREIVIPKGTLVVGKIHKHQNLNILSKGEISLMSIDGVVRVKAPFTVVSSPGVKRLAYAHEECVWTTIHGTSETDLKKLEEQFITPNYDDVISKDEKEILNAEVKPCLG